MHATARCWLEPDHPGENYGLDVCDLDVMSRCGGLSTLEVYFSKVSRYRHNTYGWIKVASRAGSGLEPEVIKVDNWVYDGWGRIAPNVFVEYLLEHHQLPDWAREPLERIDFTYSEGTDEPTSTNP